MFFSLLILLGKLIVSNVFPSERLVNRSRSAHNWSFETRGKQSCLKHEVSPPYMGNWILDSTLWSPDSSDWIPDSFSVKLGFRIPSLVGFRTPRFGYRITQGFKTWKFRRFQIPELKVSSISWIWIPFRGGRSLKGDVTRYDSQQRFLAQHSVATLLRHGLEYLQHCSNTVRFAWRGIESTEMA